MKSRTFGYFIPALDLTPNKSQPIKEEEPPKQVTIELSDFKTVAAQCPIQLFTPEASTDKKTNAIQSNRSLLPT